MTVIVPSRSDEIENERQCSQELRETVQRLIQIAARGDLWRWGDGYGGWILDLILVAATEAGFPLESDSRKPAKTIRKSIPKSLRKCVFERDKYRCAICGDWHDLQVDHIIPVVLGGTNEIDNLRTLCGPCNSSKGGRLEDWQVG